MLSLTKGDSVTLDDIKRELAGGGEVRLAGVGILRVKDTSPREMRNPKTGEVVHVPAGRRVRFKQSSTMGAALNG